MLLEFIMLICWRIIVNGVHITYPTKKGLGIGDFDYHASDDDNDEGPYAFLDDTCKIAQTDEDLDTGCQIKSSNTPLQFTWGIGPNQQQNLGVSGTKGMVGSFYATGVALGANPSTVVDVSISFREGCLSDMDLISQDSSFYYTDSSGSSVTNSITLSAVNVSGVTTYTANLVECIVIECEG